MMTGNNSNRFLILFILLMSAACTTSPRAQDRNESAVNKIRFHLDDINVDGLRGPRGGQVMVTYEFCVPADEKTYATIRRIDSAIQIKPGSKGRMGCSDTEALSIGQTAQSGWRDVLLALAALPYVHEIREAFFE